jgi:hypothetical protein
LDEFGTSLRFGTLTGATGTVLTQLQDLNTSNYDIVITAITSGTFGGSIIIAAPLGFGNDGGELIIRGPGTQTLTGTLALYKDTVIGNGATLVLAKNASFGGQERGAVTMAGGTLILDNTNGNVPVTGRMRDGSATSTALETIGGGTLRLIGNASGTIETAGRLQLGAFTTAIDESRPRAGQLSIELVHAAGPAGPTELRFQSYSRDTQNLAQFATVDFSARTPAGAVLPLGTAGNSPKVLLHSANFSVPLLIS